MLLGASLPGTGTKVKPSPPQCFQGPHSLPVCPFAGVWGGWIGSGSQSTSIRTLAVSSRLDEWTKMCPWFAATPPLC